MSAAPQITLIASDRNGHPFLRTIPSTLTVGSGSFDGAFFGLQLGSVSQFSATASGLHRFDGTDGSLSSCTTTRLDDSTDSSGYVAITSRFVADLGIDLPRKQHRIFKPRGLSVDEMPKGDRDITLKATFLYFKGSKNGKEADTWDPVHCIPGMTHFEATKNLNLFLAQYLYATPQDDAWSKRTSGAGKTKMTRS